MRRNSPSRRRPRFESLETRAMMATDLGQITGVVRNDLSGDGVTTIVAASVQVELFRDNGNGVFGTGDTSVTTTTTNGSGAYTFSGLTAGGYFVRVNPGATQQTRVGQNVTSLISVSAGEAMGATTTIDSFITSQTLTATGSGADVNSADGANAGAGAVRDLRLRVTSAGGSVSGMSGTDPAGLIEFNPSLTASYIANIVWDGTDANGAAIDASGLSLDATSSGQNIGLQLRVTADQVGGSVTVRAYSGAGNVSSATFTITDTDLFDGDAAETVTILFADDPTATPFFTTTTGSGANFANLGALEIEVNTGSNNAVDTALQLVGAFGYTTKQAPLLTVLNRMSLGDLIWIDRNNTNGVFDLGTDVTIDGATVVLCMVVDANNDGIPESETQVGTPLTTTGGGRYLFSDLLPGSYVVKVQKAGPLANAKTLTGNDDGNGVPPDADDPTTAGVETDKGDGEPAASGFWRSRIVTLFGNAEPTNDQRTGQSTQDGNNNSNLTVDFGFCEIDVLVTKALTPVPTTVAPGDTLTYSVTVQSRGRTDAPGVTLSDVLGPQLTFVSASGVTGTTPLTVTPAGQTLTSAIGTMVQGQLATFTVVATVNQNASGTIVNTASINTVSGDLDNTTSPNSAPVSVAVGRTTIPLTKRNFLTSRLRVR
ncbi:MAG: SdrD B-like domain-containing protein [Lacipirellulaceae bacterium]